MISYVAPPSNAGPVNLLDNSDFRNPVNQRGQTSITGPFDYFIDRWVVEEGSSNISDGINVSSGYLVQRILAKNIRSAIVTLAACDSNKNVYVGGNAGIVYPSSEGYDFYTIKLNPGRTYIWAALYEGAYATDALPAYTPKPYSAEIAECRRYYQRYNYLQYETIGMSYEGPAYCCVQISVLGQMRVKYPTLAVSAPLAIGTQNRTPNTANVTSGNAILGLNYSVIAGYAGATYSYTSNAAGVTIELSADL